MPQTIENLRGLDEVRVEKESVLKKLHENKAQHRDVFLEALEGFHVEIVRQLEQRLDDARNNRAISLHFNLPRPADHTRDYERAIAMLEMSLDEELVLTDQEFSQYVLDDWNWMREFVGTSSLYVSSAKNKEVLKGKENV